MKLGSKNKKHLRGEYCDPYTASSVFLILVSQIYRLVE